jgi:hypothetical protein
VQSSQTRVVYLVNAKGKLSREATVLEMTGKAFVPPQLRTPKTPVDFQAFSCNKDRIEISSSCREAHGNVLS